MIAKIINPYVYHGISYQVNDLVEMPESLFNHLFEVSAVQPVNHSPVIQIFDALVSGNHFSGLSEEIKEKIFFTQDEERYHFRVNQEVDGKQVVFYYAIPKENHTIKEEEN